MTDEKKNEAPEAKTEPTVVVDREKYQASRSASGAKSLNNGDTVAAACEGMNIDEMFILAKKMTGEDFKERYAKLNLGMQRMNLGNRIRGSISKLNKAGASPKEGAEANPTAGDQKFESVSGPIVERVAKRLEKEAEAKAKVADKKQKEAQRKADAKTSDAKRAEDGGEAT